MGSFDHRWDTCMCYCQTVHKHLLYWNGRSARRKIRSCKRNVDDLQILACPENQRADQQNQASNSSGWNKHLCVETENGEIECHLFSEVVTNPVHRLVFMPLAKRCPVLSQSLPIEWAYKEHERHGEHLPLGCSTCHRRWIWLDLEEAVEIETTSIACVNSFRKRTWCNGKQDAYTSFFNISSSPNDQSKDMNVEWNFFPSQISLTMSTRQQLIGEHRSFGRREILPSGSS